MTYKLNPFLGKIISSIVLTFPDGERYEFENGESVVAKEFNQKYEIISIRAVEDVVEIEIKPAELYNGISFF